MLKNSYLKTLWQHLWPTLPIALPAAYLATYALWTDSFGNIVTALNTGWGDMVVHIRSAIFYAEQGGLPRESFLLSGQPVGYAWLADFLSSLLLHLNVPLAASFAIPTILLTAFFVIALQYVSKRLTQSRLAATLTALLFLGFSGLNGFYLLPKLQESDTNWLTTLRTLPHQITAWHEADMVILNPLVMMLHQRGYLLGLPLLVISLYSTWHWLTKTDRRHLLILTLTTIFLAFTHPFTWAAWLLILPTWMLLLHLSKITPYTRQQWMDAAGAFTLAAGAGYLIIILLQPSANSALSWSPGWLAPDHTWPLFWIKNIGLYSLLVPLAIHHLWKTNRPLALGVIASLLPFLAANLFQFAPWDWDNTKLFVPTWLFFSLATAVLLTHWWHKQNLPARQIIVIASIGILIFSGSLEISRVLSLTNHPHIISTPTDLAIGETVRGSTARTDVIFTASNPPNHPVFLHGGRPSFIAYEGWLWSQGWKGIYEPRAKDASIILKGTPQSRELIKYYGIDVVAIGPQEKRQSANQPWYDQNFPILFRTENYTLYNTSQ